MHPLLRRSVLLRGVGASMVTTAARAAPTATLLSDAHVTGWQYSGHRAWRQPAPHWLVRASVAIAALALGIDQADNCGIIGVVGGDDDASKYLIEGLTIMRNRGCVHACVMSAGPYSVRV